MTLKLIGSTSGYTAIDAPATAGSNTLVLPTGNGNANEVLETDGSGNLSWAAPKGSLLKRSFYEIERSSFTQVDFPGDDTVPQRDEGVEVFSQAYTPAFTAGSEVYITAQVHCAETSNVVNGSVAALFISDQDDALRVVSGYSTGGNDRHNVTLHLVHKMPTWTGEKTLSIRVGSCNVVNYQHTGADWAAALYSADASKSPFIIEEISE